MQDVRTIVSYMQLHSHKGNAYMFFTRSQKATFNSMSGLPLGSLDQIEEKVATSGNFKLIYQNLDVQIYQFVEGGTQ
jgi:hypothetical protein